jgi:succinyl-diaminopimelate desuccinylase
LIKEKSVNPPGDETGVARLLSDELELIGMKVHQYEAASKRVNVEAILPGLSERPRFLFNGHTDVVPEGDISKWTVDPFGGLVKGGRIYGRGAADMKGALAAIAIGLRGLIEASVMLKGTVIFHAVADEEVNAEFGTQYMVNKGFAKADMGIVAEGSVFGGRIAVRPAVRGNCWIKLKTYGKAAHASDPSKGINGVLNMSRLLLALNDLKLEYQPHNILPDPTISAGTVIKGGTKTNIIPEYCEAEVDVRLVPGMTDTAVVKQFQSVIENLRRQDSTFHAEAEVISYVPSVEIDRSSPILAIARKATQLVVGYEPGFHASHGTNDSYYLIQSGVPVICGFGPGDEETGNAHSSDESAKISDLTNFAEIYALSMMLAVGYETR